jgi:hypothetical protein
LNPSASWLRQARADLAEIYLGLGPPEKAEPFRRREGAQAQAQK